MGSVLKSGSSRVGQRGEGSAADDDVPLKVGDAVEARCVWLSAVLHKMPHQHGVTFLILFCTERMMIENFQMCGLWKEGRILACCGHQRGIYPK
jgi:hypothetical protein